MMTRGWKHHVNIGDIWQDEDLPFTETRDRIVERLKRLPHYKESGSGEFYYLVDELADAENESEFDCVWHDIYDFADAERIWIDLWEGK